MLSGCPALLEKKPTKYADIVKALYKYVSSLQPVEDADVLDGASAFQSPTLKRMQYFIYEAPTLLRLTPSALRTRIDGVTAVLADFALPCEELIEVCPRLLAETPEKLHITSSLLHACATHAMTSKGCSDEENSALVLAMMRQHPRLLFTPVSMLARIAVAAERLHRTEDLAFALPLLLDCKTSEFVSRLLQLAPGCASTTSSPSEASKCALSEAYSKRMRALSAAIAGGPYIETGEPYAEAGEREPSAEERERGLCRALLDLCKVDHGLVRARDILCHTHIQR